MNFLKKLIPKSIFGRFVLMIALPTIIVQIVAIYVFYYSYVDIISKHLARSVLSEMLFVKEIINVDNNKELIDRFSKNIDLDFYFDEGKKIKKRAKLTQERKQDYNILFFDPLPIIDPLNRFKIELESYGFTPFSIGRKPNDLEILKVQIQLENGILNFWMPERRLNSSTKYVFTAWLVFASILTSAISIAFLKNQIKSIKGLSNAAEKFGRGMQTLDFRPSGATEIRLVGKSFIRMKERIARQISQRTRMLSAISHDLRTPLTRMKLQLEMMPNNSDTQELKSDIGDMTKMVNEYLEFSQDNEKKERLKDVKITAFLEKMVIYYKVMGQNIELEANLNDDIKISLREGDFKRVMRNLINNSFNYGTRVIISAKADENNLTIVVNDNGEGIKPSQRDKIFQPFYRIDSARNLDKVGTGLGLAIVLDIVSDHGGTIVAKDSSLGGLAMEINLPV